jgi:hypothetical protein
MTPEQAKTKWCPYVRLTVWIEARGVTDNRTDDVLKTRCLADGCMAWRQYGADGHGYCGLAGKPS